jgi:hypothetical protein
VVLENLHVYTKVLISLNKRLFRFWRWTIIFCMKIKFKHWWSLIPSLSTKRTITSHLNWIKKCIATYDARDMGLDVGQAHTCGGLKPVGSQPPLLIIGSPTDPIIKRGGWDPIIKREGWDPIIKRGGWDPIIKRGGWDPIIKRGGWDPIIKREGWDLDNRISTSPLDNRILTSPLDNRISNCNTYKNKQ